MKAKTLFKSIVNEEHEAVEVNLNGYRPEKAVTLSIMSEQVTFRFNKMPTEITVRSADNDDGGMGAYYKIREATREKLKELHEKNPEKAEEIRLKIPDLLSKSDAKEIENELEEEFNELLDHLVVMLKAKAVQFVHEHKAAADKYHEKVIRELLRQINDELAK